MASLLNIDLARAATTRRIFMRRSELQSSLSVSGRPTHDLCGPSFPTRGGPTDRPRRRRRRRKIDSGGPDRPTQVDLGSEGQRVGSAVGRDVRSRLGWCVGSAIGRSVRGEVSTTVSRVDLEDVLIHFPKSERVIRVTALKMAMQRAGQIIAHHLQTRLKAKQLSGALARFAPGNQMFVNASSDAISNEAVLREILFHAEAPDETIRVVRAFLDRDEAE